MAPANSEHLCPRSTETPVRALVIQDDRSARVEERPTPTLEPNQFILRVTTIALNPAGASCAFGDADGSDWMTVSANSIGFRVGSDCVGVVEEVGSGVPAGVFEKGQRRAVLTSPNEHRGAFAEYIAVKYDDENWLVPDEVTDEQAATTPVPFFTAVLGLCGKTRLNVPQPSRDGQRSASGTIYVHAGSTSVGVYAIQLAKMAGLSVVASSSEHNWPVLRKLGADKTLDYRDPGLVDQVKKFSGGGVDYVFDCYTVRACASSI